jgi:hypothetical protein
MRSGFPYRESILTKDEAQRIVCTFGTHNGNNALPWLGYVILGDGRRLYADSFGSYRIRESITAEKTQNI